MTFEEYAAQHPAEPEEDQVTLYGLDTTAAQIKAVDNALLIESMKKCVESSIKQGGNPAILLYRVVSALYGEEAEQTKEIESRLFRWASDQQDKVEEQRRALATSVKRLRAVYERQLEDLKQLDADKLVYSELAKAETEAREEDQ